MLRRFSDVFLFGRLPGTLAILAQRLQEAVSRIASDGLFPPLRGADNWSRVW